MSGNIYTSARFVLDTDFMVRGIEHNRSLISSNRTIINIAFAITVGTCVRETLNKSHLIRYN